MEELNNANEIEMNVFALLQEVIDPELGINIIDLGLVYEISYTEETGIKVLMTLSSKGCPMGDVIMNDIEKVLEAKYPKIKRTIELTWEPVWTTDRVTEKGMSELNKR